MATLLATKKVTGADQAFITKLQALYDIENAILKALPKMEKAAVDAELKQGFATHLKETEEHVARLEDAFDLLEERPRKLASEGIRGIIEDGAWIMKADAPEHVHDAMIASAARYVEHYEMAGYMSAIAEAEALGHSEIADILEKTLAEEKHTDEKLAAAMEKQLRTAKA